MENEGSNHVIEVKDTARRQMMRDAWRLVKPDLDIGGEMVGLGASARLNRA